MTNNRWVQLCIFLALAGLMMAMSGYGFLSVILILGLVFVSLRFATKPFSQAIARIRASIRWKFEIAIVLIAALFLFVGLFAFGAMDFMHAELHEVQELLDAQQFGQTRIAIDELEDTHHGLLFSMTPYLSLVGLLLAGTLSAALASSVIAPVRQMGAAMQRIASGDFSQPLHVDNKDELGDLAYRINQTSGELEKLQEAILAEERAGALRERMTQVTLAQEEERRRISRELHDGLGPSLAGIGNRIKATQRTLRSDPQAAERELEETAGILKGHVQECLSNIQKHADATRVEVGLQMTDSRLELRVIDNGRGFDPMGISPGSAESGLGLRSMQERAELLGGSLSVDSSPGGGCQVIFSIQSTEVEDGDDPHPSGR